MSDAPTTSSPPEQKGGGGPLQRLLASTHPGVFFPAAIIIVAFVLFVILTRGTPDDPGAAERMIGWLNENIVGGFGWYYIALVSAFVVFAIWLGLGHFGDIKLGKDDEKPEFSMTSWLAMLFAAGMGIGLVFFGVAEPLGHFASPKPGFEGDAAERAEAGLVQTFLHWGLHPWAIYAVIGLAIAYAVHRKGRPVSIRWALEPVLGDKVKGRWGDVIDITAIVGTLFGVATSLGIGVTQIASGLEFMGVEGVADSTPTQVLLIGGITLVATLSVVTGVKKGIKWLSNINMGMAAGLLIFVLIAGPTLFLFRDFFQNIGLYLQNLLQLSFDVTATRAEDGEAWQADWTTFYWGWWISWAPFVGVFIARISRGRTIRQFVGGVLLIPTTISFLWFTVLGGTALYRELFQGGGLVADDGTVNSNGALFEMLEAFPGGTIVAGLTVLLIVLFFVTSSDSGSFVVDMLASGGDPNPPTWSRVFWAVAEGAIAAVLLMAGGETGLGALQTMAIVIAFPFSIVMILMAYATYRELHAERQAILRIQRRRYHEELTEHVSQSLIDSGLVEDPGDDGGSDRPKEPAGAK